MSGNGSRLPLRQLRALLRKELVQLTRDRALFAMILYLFTVNIWMQGNTDPIDLNRMPLAVHDGDRTPASRDLLYRFRPPYFRLAHDVRTAAAGQRLLDEGDVHVLLDIPERFEETLQRGDRPARVQLLVDTTHVTVGYLASSYAARIAAGFGALWAEQRRARVGTRLPTVPRIENRRRIRYNPVLKDPWFNALAELLGMMTVACILLPATAMVREKERGTVEQLLVSPVTPFQILSAKVLAMILVMLLASAVSLFGILQPFFGVPARGSLPVFFGLTALYAFTTAGLGLVLGTFARTSAQTGLLCLLVVIPTVLLSGTWTPIESMPHWLRTAMELSPLRHFVVVAFGILIRGATFTDVLDPVLKMTALGSVLFLVGCWRFRRQLG